MRHRKKLAALAMLLVLAAAAAAWGYRFLHPGSLAAWVDQVARPGFRLRYRTRTTSHYVAVFQAGDDWLAFCRKRLGRGAHGPEPPVEITDPDGNDAADRARAREPLTRIYRLGLADYSVDDGELVPVRPGFRGTLRVRFDPGAPGQGAAAEDADPFQLRLLDVPIEWGGKGNDE